MIISFSPNTSLTRQRSIELTDPDDHQPTQVIISLFGTQARRACEGSFKRPQETQSPNTFLSHFILSILLISPKFSCAT